MFEEVFPFVVEVYKFRTVPVLVLVIEVIYLFPIRKADFQRITYSRKLALVEFAMPNLDHTICDFPRSGGKRIRGQMIPVLEK